jgi:hypothetical protein
MLPVMRTQTSTKKRATRITTGWAVTAVTAVTLVTAVTACGGQAGNSGQGGAAGAGAGGVASLPAPAGQSPSGTQTAAGSQGGPKGLTGVTLPDNAPPAEVNRIQAAWATCMENHGDHDFVAKAGGYLTSNDGLSGAAIKFPAALKACKSLQPHPPWQEIPQYNPNYNRDEARSVSCMNQRGVPVTAVPGGWNFDGTSKYSESERDKITVECEMQAFNES